MIKLIRRLTNSPKIDTMKVPTASVINCDKLTASVTTMNTPTETITMKPWTDFSISQSFEGDLADSE
ncbi:MAG: hypothetical protein ACYC1M_00985 [Armatimonadota bacterium]